MLVLCLSFSIALLDQAMKYLARCHLMLNGEVTVIPNLFSLHYVRNTGAAWGILSGFNSFLIVLSVVMLGVIVGCRRFFLTGSLLHRITAGLMVGGIIGNLVDRIRLGYVVDFLDFYWRNHHFPAFNVADSAICIGVGLYVISQILLEQRPQPGEPGQAACTNPDH